jgi:hypothetical protein
MTFSFEKDYLTDLEPVLAELERTGHSRSVTRIEECKAAGSTGGEILSCINSVLRETLQRETPPSLTVLIKNYLRKAPRY